MKIGFHNFPGKTIEMTKEKFESLGSRKKLFFVISEEDSLSSKQQSISNQIGTGAKKEPKQPEAPEGERRPRKRVSQRNES